MRIWMFTPIVGALALGGCATMNPAAEIQPAGARSVEAVERLIREQTDEAAADVSEADIAEAWTQAEAGACEDAAETAEALLRAAPENVEARLIVAECAMKSGDAARAERAFADLVDETRDPRALRGLGVLRAREGRYDEAERLLREAVEARPDDWRILNALGFLADVERDWGGAVASYERAAELAPREPAPLNNLGLSYLQQGRPESAIGAFNRALDRDADFAPADKNLRVALIVDGQLERALWGVSDEERPVVLNNAGVIARGAGDLELARSLFQRALDESPVFYEQAYRNLQALREPGSR
ncbi:tetratricopeptide repeat protein [Marinicauda salina]|nr:tetratricopeptide repeat protein [Marinicauda salina]